MDGKPAAKGALWYKALLGRTTPISSPFSWSWKTRFPSENGSFFMVCSLMDPYISRCSDSSSQGTDVWWSIGPFPGAIKKEEARSQSASTETV